MFASLNDDADNGFLKELFTIYDQQSLHFLTKEQLQSLYSEIRIGGLSTSQVVASMEYVCGNSDSLLQRDLKSAIKEMDRRFYLVQDLQWEFALLDNLHVGRINIDKARFLFQAVHGNLFSPRKFERFLHTRPVPLAPISFNEMEVELCNRPQLDDFDVFDTTENSDKSWPRLSSKVDKIPKPEIVSNSFLFEDPVLVPTKDEVDTSVNVDKSTLQAEKEEARRKEREEAQRMEEEEKRRSAEEEARRREKEELKRMKRAARRAERQAKATEEKERLRFNLEDAVDAEEQELLDSAIKQYKAAKPKHRTCDDLLAKAERLLEMLKCREALADASARRMIEDLEKALGEARKKGFHKSYDELAKEIGHADELLERLRRIERLRNEVLKLKQSTIAEIRSYQKPMPVIHQVMIATYLLLGVPEKDTKKWSNIQILLGKTGREGLMRRISQSKINDVPREVAARARNLMGDVDLEVIRDVSAGAATFFVWVEGMVEEVLNDV